MFPTPEAVELRSKLFKLHMRGSAWEIDSEKRRNTRRSWYILTRRVPFHVFKNMSNKKRK